MFGRSLSVAYIAGSLNEVFDTPSILGTPARSRNALLHICWEYLDLANKLHLYISSAYS